MNPYRFPFGKAISILFLGCVVIAPLHAQHDRIILTPEESSDLSNWSEIPAVQIETRDGSLSVPASEVQKFFRLRIRSPFEYGFQKILAFVRSEGGSPAPSLQDYGDLGINTLAPEQLAQANQWLLTYEAEPLESSEAIRHALDEFFLSSLVPEAVAYRAATGISVARTVAVSDFLMGLEALGLRVALLDAACYRADTQPGNGTLTKSLLGNGDLTLHGGVERRANGLYFDGIDDFAEGSVPAHNGPRTLVCIHSGLLDNTSQADVPVFQLRNGGNHILNENMSGPNAGRSSYGGAAVRIFGTNTGWGRSTTSFIEDYLSDDGLGGPTSLSGRRAPLGPYEFSRTTVQGEPPHTLDRLRLCISANHDLSTKWAYVERMVQGWALFDIALTDEQQVAVSKLLSETLFPRYRMVWEGDSITNFLQLRASQASYFQGGNWIWKNLALSGDATNNGLTQLGDDNVGLSDSNLGVSSGIPCIAQIQYGQNDLGNYPSRSVAEIHANLRQLWAYARARGAKVATRTVLQASSVYPTSREIDRIELNALIRADEGIHYDVLIDLDQWCLDYSSHRPYYNDPNLFGESDKIHPLLTPGKGCDLMVPYLGQRLKEAGLIP